MKHIRFAVYAAAAIVLLFALLTVSGCGGGGGNGGKIVNGISSPWNGTLAGVATVPADQDVNVVLDSWLRVWWPDKTKEPPRVFDVTLQKEETPGNWGGVHTRLSLDVSDPLHGDWSLEPVSNFSPFTWYRIIIDADGERVIAMFMTGKLYSDSLARSTRSLDASNPKFYRPAGATKGTGEGSITHTITR